MGSPGRALDGVLFDVDDTLVDTMAAFAAAITAAAPLVQERMVLLGESVGMLGFLFTADDALVIEDDARSALKDTAAPVLDAAVAALGDVDDFTAEPIQAALNAAIVEGLGIKPRLAFTPLRVAVSGRRVSPPLFESLELLGRDRSLDRLRGGLVLSDE